MWYRNKIAYIQLKEPMTVVHQTSAQYDKPMFELNPPEEYAEAGKGALALFAGGAGAQSYGPALYTSRNPLVSKGYYDSGLKISRQQRIPRGARILNFENITVDDANLIIETYNKIRKTNYPPLNKNIDMKSLARHLEQYSLNILYSILVRAGFDVIELSAFQNYQIPPRENLGNLSKRKYRKYRKKGTEANYLIINNAILIEPDLFTKERLGGELTEEEKIKLEDARFTTQEEILEYLSEKSNIFNYELANYTKNKSKEIYENYIKRIIENQSDDRFDTNFIDYIKNDYPDLIVNYLRKLTSISNKFNANLLESLKEFSPDLIKDYFERLIQVLTEFDYEFINALTSNFPDFSDSYYEKIINKFNTRFDKKIAEFFFIHKPEYEIKYLSKFFDKFREDVFRYMISKKSKLRLTYLKKVLPLYSNKKSIDDILFALWYPEIDDDPEITNYILEFTLNHFLNANINPGQARNYSRLLKTIYENKSKKEFYDIFRKWWNSTWKNVKNPDEKLLKDDFYAFFNQEDVIRDQQSDVIAILFINNFIPEYLWKDIDLKIFDFCFNQKFKKSTYDERLSLISKVRMYKPEYYEKAKKLAKFYKVTIFDALMKTKLSPAIEKLLKIEKPEDKNIEEENNIQTAHLNRIIKTAQYLDNIGMYQEADELLQLINN